MKKILLLKDKFTQELAIDFIQIVNNQEVTKFDIYLTSDGGYLECMEIILNIINDNPERFKLITTGDVCSSAFDLLLYSKCEKQILNSTRGMFHLSYSSIDLNSTGNPTFFKGVFDKKESKKRYEIELQEATKLGIKGQALKDFKAGKETWYNAEQIREFIKLDWNYDN